jgi:hypothetical protein
VTTPSTPLTTTIADLLARYRGFAIDAYGVLVDAGRALPGAASSSPRSIAAARHEDQRRLALLARPCARPFAALGLPIPADRVVTSGELPGRHPGPARSGPACWAPLTRVAYAEAAGALIVETGAGWRSTALLPRDDAGFDFLSGSEHVRGGPRPGRRPSARLVPPNPISCTRATASSGSPRGRSRG